MNLPSDFILRTRELLGDAEFAALTEALEKDTPVSIRMNTDKCGLVPQESTSVPWCREGYYLSGRPSFTFDPLVSCGLLLCAGSFVHVPGTGVTSVCARARHDARFVRGSGRKIYLGP